MIATELSRLGRNLLEVMGILQNCLEKDCQIWTLKENYHLGSDIQSKVLAFAFSLAAEIERQLISERTKNSLKRLKDEGKHLGRPHGFSYKKLAKSHKRIVEMLDKNMTKAEIAKIMGCSINNFGSGLSCNGIMKFILHGGVKILRDLVIFIVINGAFGKNIGDLLIDTAF